MNYLYGFVRIFVPNDVSKTVGADLFETWQEGSLGWGFFPIWVRPTAPNLLIF